MQSGRRIAKVVLSGAVLLGFAVLLFALPQADRLMNVLGTVFTVLGVVIPVWLSRGDGPDPGAGPVDQLSRAVRRQCDLDADANKLNEFDPLQLRWRRAGPELADRRGAAVDPALLTGRWDEVVAQYQRVPGGRWVVLGERGSGKSALMLHLMRKLLEDESMARVPVLFALRSWEPEQHPHTWMAEQLAHLYPTLKWPPDIARETFVAERVLPILDGLDEMAAQQRPRAIRQLNQLDPDKYAYVLTCRPDEFRDAVGTGGRRLTAAAVTALDPLPLQEAIGYLCDMPHSARDEWDALAGLDPAHPLAVALSTPLMVWLAGASYADRPAELTALSQTQEITDHLLDELIPTVYADDRRWNAADAERYLTYLARFVADQPGRPGAADPDDIAWWRLPDAAEPGVGRTAAAADLLTVGGAFGLGIGLLFGPVVGGLCGLGLGLLTAWYTRRSRLEPTTVEIRPSALSPLGLVAGVMIGLIAGAGVFVVNQDRSALLALAGFGIPLGVVYGLTSAVDVEHATSPRDVLRRERIFVLAYTLAYGLACGITAGVLTGPLFGVLLGVTAGLAGGLFNGLPWVIVARFARRRRMEARIGAVAWFRFFLAKLTWLGTPPRLPWRLLGFLDDARRHGILQQVGAVYRFRHGRLSERLADR